MRVQWSLGIQDACDLIQLVEGDMSTVDESEDISKQMKRLMGSLSLAIVKAEIKMKEAG